MSGELEPGRLVARVFVPGRPRSKGSLKPILIRAGGKVRASLTENNPESTAWKKTMMRALATAERKVYEPYAGPVEVHAFFRFEREFEVRNFVRQKSFIPSHDTPFPTDIKIGDVDKLWRNVLDALTQSHVLADDSLVIGGAPYKRWCLAGERPGVLIVVTAANEVEAVHALEGVTGEIE